VRVDVEVQARPEDVLAAEAFGIRLVDGLLDRLPGLNVLSPDVNVALGRPNCDHSSKTPLDQQMRDTVHQVAVFGRCRVRPRRR
jgi:hypothetical protein